MQPNLVTRPATGVIGLEARTANRLEADPSTARIPGLWQRFFSEHVPEQIPNRSGSGAWMAVYTNYEGDVTGEYSLVLGAEVASFDEVPEGLTPVAIPASRYLVFSAQGPMPQAVIETWGSIWSHFSKDSEHQRAYTADFEVYDQRFQSANPEVDIFIAIK